MLMGLIVVDMDQDKSKSFHKASPSDRRDIGCVDSNREMDGVDRKRTRRAEAAYVEKPAK